MKRYLAVLAVLTLISIPIFAFAAGSAMTFTETTHGSVKKVVVSWTSDNVTGGVSGTTTNGYSGRFLGAITVPGTAGAQPNDNYDITVTDADGVDLALGGLMNRDETNTEFVAEASMAGIATGKLTFNVTNASDSGVNNTGTIYLYIR